MQGDFGICLVAKATTSKTWVYLCTVANGSGFEVAWREKHVQGIECPEPLFWEQRVVM